MDIELWVNSSFVQQKDNLGMFTTKDASVKVVNNDYTKSVGWGTGKIALVDHGQIYRSQLPNVLYVTELAYNIIFLSEAWKKFSGFC